MTKFEVRLLGEPDIPAAMRLKELAHWNQTENDWLRVLRLGPSGCFCATINDELVGTITTTTYGNQLAWIGMVLVDPERRRMGIATKLMHVALEYLANARITTVKLDATGEGRSVYQGLGFEEESLIERWEGIARSSLVACSSLETVERQDVLGLDRNEFGASRSKLLEMLIEESCVAPCVATAADGRPTGYALARRGSAAVYLGPLLANGRDTAANLLDGLLNQAPGQRVYIDVNTGFNDCRTVLIERGFAKRRDLIRMSYGKKSKAGSSRSIFAIAGPEFG